ncbi:response regulator [Candidatus Omnitrophota bacterium]
MPKLLIVDDELDVQEFAANFFRKRKFEVVTSGDGQKALELLETENPNLILLDIKMNGMDGIETLKNIREKNKEIPVVMVTGRKPDEDESCRRCEEMGISGYIHKPLELSELERVVLSLLR